MAKAGTCAGCRLLPIQFCMRPYTKGIDEMESMSAPGPNHARHHGQPGGHHGQQRRTGRGAWHHPEAHGRHEALGAQRRAKAQRKELTNFEECTKGGLRPWHGGTSIEQRPKKFGALPLNQKPRKKTGLCFLSISRSQGLPYYLVYI